MSEIGHAPTLTAGDVMLRALEVSDAAAWLAGEDDEQLRWFEMPAATLDDVTRAIERWQASWQEAGPVQQWGIWVDGGGALAGGVQLRVRDDRRANLSYVVFPAHRRQGVATAAVMLAAAWGLEHLDIDAVVAIVNEDNVASRGVATAAGFELDGRAEPWEQTESGVMMLRHLLRS